MANQSRAELYDDEGKQRSEAQIVELQKVARLNALGMVLEEGRPRLTTQARRPGLAHIPLDGPLRDLNADFEQLTVNAIGAPQSVVGSHLLDQ